MIKRSSGVMGGGVIFVITRQSPDTATSGSGGGGGPPLLSPGGSHPRGRQLRSAAGRRSCDICLHGETIPIKPNPRLDMWCAGIIVDEWSILIVKTSIVSMDNQVCFKSNNATAVLEDKTISDEAKSYG